MLERFVNLKPRFRLAIGKTKAMRIGWLELRLGPRGYFIHW
jgi:hypothetical protein